MYRMKTLNKLFFASACLAFCALVSGCSPLKFTYQGDRGDVFYPNIDSTQPKPVLPKRKSTVPGVFSIEPRAVDNGNWVSFSENIPDFDPNNGGFNARNPNLVAGVRYHIKFTPKDRERYGDQTFSTSFLVQGLAYRSGVYRLDSTQSLAPTYNGDGKSPLPTQAGATQYNFALRDSDNKEVYQQGNNRDAPANPVVGGQDVQLNFSNLKSLIVSRGLTGKPLLLSIEYRLVDAGLPIAARKTIEIYYFPTRAGIDPEVLKRAQALSQVGNFRPEEVFAERPPIIIFVDQL
jgi:hypothetical protein